MSFDTSLLLQGLKEYQKTLKMHGHVVAQEYAQLDNQWHAFEQVYEGDSAREFKSYWSRTQQRFEEYIEAVRKIGIILNGRIDELERVNREGDLQ